MRVMDHANQANEPTLESDEVSGEAHLRNKLLQNQLPSLADLVSTWVPILDSVTVAEEHQKLITAVRKDEVGILKFASEYRIADIAVEPNIELHSIRNSTIPINGEQTRAKLSNKKLSVGQRLKLRKKLQVSYSQDGAYSAI